MADRNRCLAGTTRSVPNNITTPNTLIAGIAGIAASEPVHARLVHHRQQASAGRAPAAGAGAGAASEPAACFLCCFLFRTISGV
ncbi:uncharacterized protein ASCRUDRAFT_78899 [Ascoidea rubescens DSM 1968]|uniref:Uncharacterized protein n=1 Tax=Ascoidea rubescens DSM 1968 TaxID=1344418 RepID=A0A1D2VQT5_9ASCO|nr:hypothetical protein ASCRUDRAFT_78899 [Ascoidea rubescens DSM 1968]ODV63925.1 hypothetical protein ASCRUDRAFT_78899 [Ascoidea rubescens DSM 1968]